ncbi:fimbria/pilus periplasmic chaperone [Variovorax sp. PCZ-1]|uniref:fimbrial biogenesis chaperone n=1 Tax=Variovorax sp. PCZ-1 TaxID=2835533 RepID=UPI001BCD4F38|nr:fimbria/pilus periplasmic chaperone [Variovorax sp. PCZ-1]MBS7808033.1 molecular chaperone [Variovorax sp. PCZ-1]
MNAPTTVLSLLQRVSFLPCLPRAALSFAMALAAVLPAAPALAGSFSVTPVRVYMSPRDRAVAITITNEGDSPVALQADINVWSQKPDGTDELVLTEDMVLSPPIIKLGPKARQVVRLALLKPADASRQLTYRLIVREIPEATAPKGNSIEVPVALALSMPVFITPPIAKREINCQANREGVALAITCANTGSAYAQIREILVLRGDAAAAPLARFEGGAYILPGARKSIGISAAQPIAAGEATLKLTFDDGKDQSFVVRLP